MNVKETIENEADKDKEKRFTSSVIDSQMGKKLGVTDTGTENHKIEGTVFKAPEPDDVENINLVQKLSAVKNLFQIMRDMSIDTMKQCREIKVCGSGPWPDIWCEIEELAKPVYADLDFLNDLIEDRLGDHENPDWHCSVTHCVLCPKELRKRITPFKCVIQDGVVDVMINQALLPKCGKNILDAMWNQLWEYGEKGPTIELPNWCQNAIDAVNAFEDSMLDAWTEVYDCWEREFLTRLWHIEVEHHGGGTDGRWLSYGQNWQRLQTEPVETEHNHTHPVPQGAMLMTKCKDGKPVIVDVDVITETAEATGFDTYNFDTTDLVGKFTCPGHDCPGEGLLAPVCTCYKVIQIDHLAKHYREDIKALCQWMCAAIEAVGIKQAAISAVMSDPSLNGNCDNMPYFDELNDLRQKNSDILADVEDAYGMYSDVDNMKNKKEYDEEIALHELQPNKYSNEDQLNMTSSVQSETSQPSLCSEVCDGDVAIPELKPWNHLNPSDNKVEPPEIPSKCACNKFDKVVQSLAGFEKMMNFQTEEEKEAERKAKEEEEAKKKEEQENKELAMTDEEKKTLEEGWNSTWTAEKILENKNPDADINFQALHHYKDRLKDEPWLSTVDMLDLDDPKAEKAARDKWKQQVDDRKSGKKPKQWWEK